MRARFVRRPQGEPARPPGEGRRHDPMPPSSPGETPAGPSTLSEAAVPVGGEAESRPQPRKRHQKRLQRQSGNARKASKGPGRAEGSPRQAKLGRDSGTGVGRAHMRRIPYPCTCVEYSVVCPLAPSRGGVLQLRGNPVHGTNPRRPVFTLRPFPCERAPPGLGLSSP